MKINISVTFGFLIGWFIVPPFVESVVNIIANILLKQIVFINRTPIETLENSIMGLFFALLVGLILGSFEDLTKEKEKHRKMMSEFEKWAKEMKNGKSNVKQK